MKRFAILIALLLGFTFPAYAQQDPDDPGIQDSIIIDEVVADIHAQFAFMRIFFVTDDSVVFYNFPLRWTAPQGGVFLGADTLFSPPLTFWDENYDTVITSESYIRQIGFADLGGDDNPPLITNGPRVNVWTLRIILNNPRSQIVVFDSTWDSRNGSVEFGLAGGVIEITPGIKRGFLWIDGGGASDTNNIPITFSLSQNYPNPFNSSTEIEFSLPQSGPVSLVIYDIQGREIRRLLDGNLEAGSHSVIWNGLNSDGRPVSSGIYFYRLVSNNSVQTNRMTLLR